MKKIYKIFLLLFLLIFLSTYSFNQLDLDFNEKKFFNIKFIKIENNFLIKKEEIKQELEHIYDKNIFFISKIDLEKPLKKVNFLNKINVRKKYPDTIVIKIFENKPIAILYKKNNKYILDDGSNLISYEDNNDLSILPIIYGDNDESNFTSFFKELKKNDFPTKKVKKYYFFQIGRWDLELQNNKIIKFPYKNIEEAIKKSVELLDRKDFVNYKSIDLRVDGKIIVE